MDDGLGETPCLENVEQFIKVELNEDIDTINVNEDIDTINVNESGDIEEAKMASSKRIKLETKDVKIADHRESGNRMTMLLQKNKSVSGETLIVNNLHQPPQKLHVLPNRTLNYAEVLKWAGLPPAKKLETRRTYHESMAERMRLNKMKISLEQRPKIVVKPRIDQKRIDQIYSETYAYAEELRSREQHDESQVDTASKKVLMERERRKGLAQLFDHLDDMTNSTVNDKGQLVVSESCRKTSYGERTRAAKDCIAKLENDIGVQEISFSKEMQRNLILRSKLKQLQVDGGHEQVVVQEQDDPASPLYSLYNNLPRTMALKQKLKQLQTAQISAEESQELKDLCKATGSVSDPPSSLYSYSLYLYSCSCSKHKNMTNLKEAFLHHDRWHSPPTAEMSVADLVMETRGKGQVKGPRFNPIYDLGPAPSRGRPKQVTVVKCQECPAVCLDMDVLRVHKFLHQPLAYLRCPDCRLVFGTPSSLRRHLFLRHNALLPAEALANTVLGIRERVDLTTKVQEALETGDPEQLELVDNFLSATLDARLVLGEIELQVST